MIEKLSECAKVEIDKGIEKIDTEEMSKVSEIIKELTEAEYYATITKAMEEYSDEYEELEDGRRGYRGQPRSSSGRFISRNDGRRSNRGRRGYVETMDYDEPRDWNEMERMRDIDRMGYGRMYYSSSNPSGNMNSDSSNNNSIANSDNYGNNSMGYSESRDYREGRSGRSRKGYMESKEANRGNSAEEKKAKMSELEKYMQELSTDITEMINDASPEEKTLLKTKMQTLMTKI